MEMEDEGFDEEQEELRKDIEDARLDQHEDRKPYSKAINRIQNNDQNEITNFQEPSNNVQPPKQH
jgi:hypothetical protein